MGALLRLSGAVVAYFCIATVLAQCILLGAMWSSGRIDPQRLARAAAVLQGIELDKPGQTTATDEPQVAVRTVSLKDIEDHRATRLRELELREQSLANGLKQIRFERDKLTKEKEGFERVYE